jgi:Acetyltransferase (GNAT) domain
VLELPVSHSPTATEYSQHRHNLQLVVHEDAEPARWDRWAEDLSAGPFHCAAWARYRTAKANKRPLFFAWYEPGSRDPVAVALAIETAVPGPLTARSIHFDAPPAARLGAPRLVPDVARWMKTHRGVADAWLGSFDAVQAWTDPAARPARIEFPVDPAPEEQMLARMRRLARRSVRRAQNQGIEIDDDADRLDEFVDLYATTRDRLHQVKGLPARPIDRDGFAELLAALRAAGAARLVLATAAGVPVSGTVFAVFARRAYALHTGANELGRQSGAMAAVLYRAMCDFSACGFERMNLGGVPAGAELPSHRDHGLYAFKLGMGAVAQPCSDTRIVVRPIRRRFIESARRARSVALKIAAARPLA